jgi:hypothetical protein
LLYGAGDVAREGVLIFDGGTPASSLGRLQATRVGQKHWTFGSAQYFDGRV